MPRPSGLQVGEHDVGLQTRHVDARRAQAVRGRHAEAFRLGQLGKPFDRFGIVVYKKKMGHCARKGYR
jgi:hypothetical protein